LRTFRGEKACVTHCLRRVCSGGSEVGSAPVGPPSGNRFVVKSGPAYSFALARRWSRNPACTSENRVTSHTGTWSAMQIRWTVPSSCSCS